MKKILLLLLCLLTLSFSGCKKENTTVIPVDSVPEEASQCANALIEYLGADRYAWSYQEVTGSLNLTVDHVYIIDVYYSVGSVQYYAKYICYIINDDISWEKLSKERV